MRLARVRTADGGIQAGVVDGERVALAPGHADVTSLLQAGPATWDRIAQRAPRTSLDDVTLLAPIARPPKFIGIGFNVASHIAEGNDGERPSATPRRVMTVRKHTALAHPDPRFPTFFNKQSTCVTGPKDPVWMPKDSQSLDYEGELAIVIGLRARRVDEAGAAAAIAGYSVCNDISVRDWQLETPTMWLGKSFDTHGPIGPWVTTADAIDPSDLMLRTFVNDELRQEGSTSELIRGPVEIVSILSQFCTLEPGDIIAAGTPSGVGIARGCYLQIGDRIRVEIDGLGSIENEVIAEPVPDADRARLPLAS